MPKKKKLNLKVLFDTNPIWTKSASDLLRKEVVSLITNLSNHSDIDITWYIPEIVIKERTFQMNKEGNESLPSIEKIEKLLNLKINRDTIQKRIDLTVKKQIEANSLKIVKVDVSKVNWDSIIHKAAHRHPPFEDNKTEKGFRDAIVLECLKQVIGMSSANKKICRIAFITEDALLAKATSQITATNLDLFKNIDELISLINVLVSESTEELINSIKLLSRDFFFRVNDESTYIFTEKILDKIKEKFPTQLEQLFDDASIRENGTWIVNDPGFEKKIGQRLHYKSILQVNFEIYKYVANQETSHNDSFNTKPIQYNNYSVFSPPYKVDFGLNTAPPAQITTEVPWYYSPPFTFKPFTEPIQWQWKKEKTSEGKTKFEVIWSFTITGKKLRNPKLESINYIETIKSN